MSFCYFFFFLKIGDDKEDFHILKKEQNKE